MNKKLLYLFMLLLLSGCSLRYEAEIKEDLSVVENIELTQLKNKIVGSYSNYYNEQLNEYKYLYNSEDVINFKEINDSNSYGVGLTKQYSSVDDYVNSKYLKNFYKDGFEIIREDSIITIRNKGIFNGINYFLYGYDTEPLLKSVVVKLKVPYVITGSDATVISDENVAMWIYNSNSSYKDFNISFDTNQKYEYIDIVEVQKKNIVIYVLIGIVVITGLIFLGRWLWKRNMKNNKL
ncbi:MAG: hypothetical protein Q4G04_03400 [bacterium]|nr:hypothetical protein [bacterium]